ncbi:unnamed protein product [Penicillium salamii]|uniref:Uncharacterized protein n=1 Tax=Penicillium salamii TaxID=1612424 RepID=A0A9W4JX98_9EURO|nr:unnamed protein product [Penicillium salamii]
MPAPIEISDPLAMSRDLYDDEKLVVDDFERHAGHCILCASPTQTHKNNRSLCSRGTSYARAVANYLDSRNGKYFSAVDYESGRSTRIKLPRDAYAVRDLLAALEQGLRIRDKPVIVQPVQPVQPITVSYDRTYPIPARGASNLRPRSMSPDAYQIIERAPRLSRSPTSIMYRSPGGSPSRPTSSRGSLYDSDFQERGERRIETPRRYVQGTRYHR